VAPLPDRQEARRGELHGVLPLPEKYLVREVELTELKRALLRGQTAAVGIVGLRGLGGIGKSVLASALARDDAVRHAFPDGVYFVPFGQTPELVRLQNALAANLGVANPNILEPMPGRDRLRAVCRSSSAADPG